MLQEVAQMGRFARENNLALTGHIVGIVKRHATGLEEVVFDQTNVIATNLKVAMRDTMNANVDFAIDNLQAAQVARATLSATENGKAGIVIYDSTTLIISNIVAFMASAVHPIDASGTHYRQWQGIYQNITGGTESGIVQAEIGRGYIHTPAASPFGASGVTYATGVFAAVVLLNNDIITINWKITIG